LCANDAMISRNLFLIDYLKDYSVTTEEYRDVWNNIDKEIKVVRKAFVVIDPPRNILNRNIRHLAREQERSLLQPRQDPT
jgi:hypothetical protein